MELCSFCSSNYLCGQSGQSCHVCEGKAERFLSELSSLSLSHPENSRFFYVGLSSTPALKKAMAREEDVFDRCEGRSIKQALHDAALAIIMEKTGLKPSVSLADVVFEFSYPDPNPRVQIKPIYIYGKYSKRVPGISQKRWRKYARSVEAIIGEPLKESFSASQYYMHASGREDVDAVNVAPRPFVLELVSPQKRWLEFPKPCSKEVDVELKGYVPPSFVKLVSDSHFDKSYRAYIDVELSDEEAQLLNSFSGTLEQLTPTRVKHRRANILRKRKVYAVRVGRDEKGTYLDIDAEAGTYIKEFISGDGGRTRPSVSELVGKDVRCTFLIVTRIKDGFLDLVFQKQQLK